MWYCGKWKSHKECLLNVSKDHEYVCVSCVWMNSMTRMYVNIINMCFNSVYKIHGHIEKGEGEKNTYMHTSSVPNKNNANISELTTFVSTCELFWCVTSIFCKLWKWSTFPKETKKEGETFINWHVKTYISTVNNIL